MSQTSKSIKFFRKAEAALLAAIELYNKPDFRYREESFTILVLNAWELLLKAKLVALNNNTVKCLHVYESRQTKQGKPSKREYLRKNRAGNPQSIGIGRAITDLDAKGIRLPPSVRRNMDGIMEIRDNAVHFINSGPQLSKQALELGTASVKNFIELAKIWFSFDLSNYNLYLMPIGFVAPPGTATAINASSDEERLIQYLANLVKEAADDQSTNFHVALQVNLSFKRSPSDAAAVVAITNDPDAPKVQLTEEDIRKIYPLDYRQLTDKLKKRYIDFKENQKYHDIRRPLLHDRGLVNTRFLDPGNLKSGKKDFYNPNIISEFDKHYTRKKSGV